VYSLYIINGEIIVSFNKRRHLFKLQY